MIVKRELFIREEFKMKCDERAMTFMSELSGKRSESFQRVWSENWRKIELLFNYNPQRQAGRLPLVINQCSMRLIEYSNHRLYQQYFTIIYQTHLQAT